LVPVLAAVMLVEIAMRLTLAAMLLALAGGCMALHRVAFLPELETEAIE
jgi:hypothetical protein